jgi:hypothetical protein
VLSAPGCAAVEGETTPQDVAQSEGATVEPVRKFGHQSGDGVQICHCPFCGSGQVIGRSDGNTECSFCNQSFMVRVQPMYAAFPQSVGGMPVDIPGMPGTDPAAGGMAPGEEGDAGGAPPFGDSEGAPDDGEAEDGGGQDGAGGGGGPPFGKKSSYRTAAGRRMGRAAYLRYLAGQPEAR